MDTNNPKNGNSGHFGHRDEKEKENIPPLPKGFIRASDYPLEEVSNDYPERDLNSHTSRFPSNKNVKREDLQSIRTLARNGQSEPGDERGNMSEYIQAHNNWGGDSRKLTSRSKPLKDVTNSYPNDNNDQTRIRVFGSDANDDNRHITNQGYHDKRNLIPTKIDRETSSNYMPLVPYRTLRQETYDEDEFELVSKRNPPHRKVYPDEEDDSERNTNSSSRHRNRPRKQRGSDTDDSSTQERDKLRKSCVQQAAVGA
jgi:hypothetical protein